jgi:hypothetical protein
VEVIKGKLQTASREFTMRVHDIPGQCQGISYNWIKMNNEVGSIWKEVVMA